MRPARRLYRAAGQPAPAAPQTFFPDANALDAASLNSQYKQLFLSTGTADAVVGYTNSLNFHNALDKKAIKHIWVSVQGGAHDGTTWCPGIYDFAQIIFK